jgi:peptide-methionine (S)-S-oxide reductase
MFAKPINLPSPEQALPGRDEPLLINPVHAVLGSSMVSPYPDGYQQIVFGMGCFWGVERKFWQLDGVYTTSVGYAAGMTKNPSYQEVCSGMTGHNEVVKVVFDPDKVDLKTLLNTFWQSHDPTQGMRQGNDMGTQYRSGIYFMAEAQKTDIELSLKNFQNELNQAGYGQITTELLPLEAYFYAEDYHQQYLHKNPGGYCNMKGTGVSCA